VQTREVVPQHEIARLRLQRMRLVAGLKAEPMTAQDVCEHVAEDTPGRPGASAAGAAVGQFIKLGEALQQLGFEWRLGAMWGNPQIFVALRSGKGGKGWIVASVPRP